MTLEELRSKENEIKDEFANKVSELRRQYCNENNSYKVGDIFTDHIGSIVIESINYRLFENPCCIYYGVELKKDGTPRKDGSKRQAWQSNEKK